MNQKVIPLADERQLRQQPAIIFTNSPFADFSPHLPRNKVSAPPQGV